MTPTREVRRSKQENARGGLELERVERLPADERARVRDSLIAPELASWT